ncbi:hypothetical protein WJX84_004069 [Apatococcus fuscideae]|uniref:Uncharacterized protein n=1 Tax=Apatococcus fuscideae TaxID=2026836 RepID=A0AAW1T7X0_9CHLO
MEGEEEQLDYGDVLGSPETVRKCQVQDAELEDDLYGDLVPGSFPADTGLQDKIQELTEQTQQQAARILELQAELEERTQERDQLTEEKTILSRNISCLFKTAQLEIDRKDAEIKKMRARLAQQPSATMAAAPRPRTLTGMSQPPMPAPPHSPPHPPHPLHPPLPPGGRPPNAQ